MATQKYYPKVSHATLGAFLPQLARFLVNDHATITGPTNNWTVIDTYSGAAGTPHQVPGAANDLDSLNADNGWRTGTIAANDYIILQSGDSGNKFQLGIEYQSTTLINFIIAPKGGFVTGFDNNDMTVAGNWSLVKGTTFAFTGVNAVSNYSVVAADAGGNFKLFTDDGAARYWTYIGKLIDPQANDEWPVVWYDTEQTVVAAAATGIITSGWNRISAVDDTTELANLNGVTLAYGGGSFVNNAGSAFKDADGGAGYYLAPVGVIEPAQAGHKGWQGMLDGVWVIDQDATGVGGKTLNSKAYLAMSTNAAQSSIVMQWDGATAY